MTAVLQNFICCSWLRSFVDRVFCTFFKINNTDRWILVQCGCFLQTFTLRSYYTGSRESNRKSLSGRTYIQLSCGMSTLECWLQWCVSFPEWPSMHTSFCVLLVDRLHFSKVIHLCFQEHILNLIKKLSFEKLHAISRVGRTVKDQLTRYFL